jgi:ABC-type antimicrobial peptide transport system permease subunit
MKAGGTNWWAKRMWIEVLRHAVLPVLILVISLRRQQNTQLIRQQDMNTTDV